MEIYTISLKSATERRDFHLEHLAERGINTKIVDASCGDDSAGYLELKNTSTRPLSRGEIGCFLSHRALWEKCFQQDTPILILEDDVILSKNFKQTIAALQEIKNIDRINLEAYGLSQKLFSKKCKIENGYTLTKIIRERAGSAAYIIWPSGAKKLLKHYKNRADLADICLKNYFLINYQVEPALAVQSNMCFHYGIVSKMPKQASKSTIGHKIKKNRISSLKFKWRRLIRETSHTIQNIKKLGSKKRSVKVSPKDFIH